MIDQRPGSGGGSCERCQQRLGLASVRSNGAWYCGAACAEGREDSGPRPAVPEDWLYNRPRRFFGKRRPKELNTGSGQ